jgi:hypothetical protein
MITLSVALVYYFIIRYSTFLCSFVLHYCDVLLSFSPLCIHCIGAWCRVQKRMIVILLPHYLVVHCALSLHKKEVFLSHTPMLCITIPLGLHFDLVYCNVLLLCITMVVMSSFSVVLFL